MFRHVDRLWDGLMDATWIVLVLALIVLGLVDGPLLEILAPIGCVAILWWLAAELMARLRGDLRHYTPSRTRCSKGRVKEYTRARRGLGRLTRLQHEAEDALEELRRAGAAARHESVARAISELADLHYTVQHQAARARLITVSIEASEWLERTAPLLDGSRWPPRSSAGYRVDCIAREHPYGVRILAELNSDSRAVELPPGRMLRGLLEARLNDLYRAQVDVEAESMHSQERRVPFRSAWASGERTRERLKRCLREARHRHSA